MSTFLCKNGVRKEYFLTPTFIIEPFLCAHHGYIPMVGYDKQVCETEETAALRTVRTVV